MPTLNLGRVRFNWRGVYDPLVAYQEYDCVEDDGQSYVCIAPVTGTGPNDTNSSTYWGDMLVRSADYNQARQDAIDAASAADASAQAAAGTKIQVDTTAQQVSENAQTASGAATAADQSAAKANNFANAPENDEVEPGKYSAFHWSEKAKAAANLGWDAIAGKPATAIRWPAFGEVADKPSTYPPSAHQHDWNEVRNRPATATRWPTFTEVTDKPATYPPAAHQHEWAAITGKPATATRWPSFEEVENKPSLYTKAQIDEMIGDIGSILDSINGEAA